MALVCAPPSEGAPAEWHNMREPEWHRETTMERQLSDEEVTMPALLLVIGNEVITSQIRDEAAEYLRANVHKSGRLRTGGPSRICRSPSPWHVKTKTQH